MHILSPETDNCPSWISGRERMTVENISWSISTKECCRPRRGLNPWPPGLQSDGASNWATKAHQYFTFRSITWVNVNGFSPNLMCALILWRSALELLIGKFRQFLTELYAHDTIMAGYYRFTFYFDWVEILWPSQPIMVMFVCLCWGFTAQSTQWGHVERGQFT